MDFGIAGGLGTNPLWILRDDCTHSGKLTFPLEQGALLCGCQRGVPCIVSEGSLVSLQSKFDYVKSILLVSQCYIF